MKTPHFRFSLRAALVFTAAFGVAIGVIRLARGPALEGS